MTNPLAPNNTTMAPFLRRDLLQILFQNISPVDYAALGLLLKYARDTGAEKLYLKDLAHHFQFPMEQMSKLAKDLQAKGYVQWTHDGTGEEGTYLLLNRDALDPALTQKDYLSDYFGKVVQLFGTDRFLHLLNETAALEEIMWQQTWKEEDAHAPQP